MIDLVQALGRHAERRPELAALEVPGRRYRYGELGARVSELAGVLVAAGLRPGDRLGVACYRGESPALCYLAAQAAGGVPVLLSRGLGAGWAAMATALGVRFLVVEEALAGEARSLPGLEWLATSNGEAPADRAAPPLPAGSWVQRPAHAVSSIAFSAGSTGAPKAIVRTVATDFFDALNRVLAYRCREGDRWVCASPSNLSVIGGALRAMVLVAGCVVALDRYSTAELEQATRTSVDILPLQQPQWLSLLADGLGPELARRGLREAVATGQRVPAALLDRLSSALAPGGEVIVNYGTSEASTIAVARSGYSGFGTPHCVGRPLATCEVRIEAVPELAGGDTRVGEIRVRGAAVSPGYVVDAEELDATDWSAAERTSRWFATGDAGRFDGDGNLYVLGRIGDALQLGERIVFPGEVEEHLGELAGVREAALCLAGGRLVVVLEPEAGGTGEPGGGELASSLVRDRLGAPAEAVVVERLPRTPSGKLDRPALATLVSGRAPAAVARP